MARSQTIWLLTQKEPLAIPLPVAAFTVKHELMTWLDRNRWQWDQLSLFKMKDSPSPSPLRQKDSDITELDIREVMK